MINFIEITNELFKNSFVNKLTVEVVSLRLLLWRNCWIYT